MKDSSFRFGGSSSTASMVGTDSCSTNCLTELDKGTAPDGTISDGIAFAGIDTDGKDIDDGDGVTTGVTSTVCGIDFLAFLPVSGSASVCERIEQYL